MKIWYEGKLRKVEEIESDHIHLDDGTVIRNNEIKKYPLGVNVSTWSEKKQLKSIDKNIKDIIKELNFFVKIFNKAGK